MMYFACFILGCIMGIAFMCLCVVASDVERRK